MYRQYCRGSKCNVPQASLENEFFRQADFGLQIPESGDLTTPPTAFYPPRGVKYGIVFSLKYPIFTVIFKGGSFAYTDPLAMPMKILDTGLMIAFVIVTYPVTHVVASNHIIGWNRTGIRRIFESLLELLT
jgi:hypothetical protein